MPRKLTVDVEPGEVVHVGTGTTIRLVQKSGRRARLEIVSDYSITHDRKQDAPPRPTGSSLPPMPTRPALPR